MHVTALAGGTGAAKLLRGLTALPDVDLTVIGNTGDDTEVWGLHVSPDLDSVTYALAGLLDVERGWGRRDETFRCRDAMEALGEPTWFSIGDRDAATHLVRTAALRRGEPLSRVTATIARRLGVAARILPMSDDPVRTIVDTPDGPLAFQEYFVRERARAKVHDVRYDGAADARPAPGVVEALASADVIVLCPSNPITSIGPILAVPGIVEALRSAPGPVVGVSPIVGDRPVSGPAGELMRARGLPVTVVGVAQLYAPWLGALVVDVRDRDASARLHDLGVRAVVTETIMVDAAHERALAAVCVGGPEGRADTGQRLGDP